MHACVKMTCHVLVGSVNNVESEELRLSYRGNYSILGMECALMECRIYPTSGCRWDAGIPTVPLIPLREGLKGCIKGWRLR